MARPPLRRVREGKQIAGVCTGVARHFDVDVTLVRVVFVVLLFVSGVGGFAYVLLWLMVPYER